MVVVDRGCMGHVGQSEAIESSANVAVAMLVVVVEKVGLVKVERHWRGEGLDLWSGDAGEAIFFLNFWYRKGIFSEKLERENE